MWFKSWHRSAVAAVAVGGVALLAGLVNNTFGGHGSWTSSLDDSLSLLQTHYQVDSRSRSTITGQEGEPFSFTDPLDETKWCASFVPLDLRLQLDSLRYFGYAAPRRHCRPAYPSHETLSALTIRVTSAVGSDSLFVLLPIVYIFLYFCVVMWMMISTVRARADAKPDPNHYVEDGAWKRGFINWIFVDFVTEWVARWGCRDDTDNTRVRVEDIGRFGVPEDEPVRNYRMLRQEWEKEVQNKGLKHASLFQACLRALSHARVLGLLVWTVAYESFVFLGPPIAASWTIRTIEDIYIRRLQGDLMGPADLLPATLGTIILFTGIPIMMGICNTFSGLLAARIAMRLGCGLSCLVYCKAQRLTSSMPPPSATEDEAGTARATSRSQLSDTQSNRRAGEDGESQAAPHGEESTTAEEDLGAVSSDAPDESEGISEKIANETGGAVKYNLVQLCSTDIGVNIAIFPLFAAKVFVLIPVNIVLFALLFRLIGTVTFICMFQLALFVWVIFQLGQGQGMAIYTYLYLSGERGNFCQDLFFNIRTIKSSGWEQVTLDRIDHFRSMELDALSAQWNYLGAIIMVVLQWPKTIVMVALWGTSWLTGTTADIWSTLPLLMVFQAAMITLLQSLPLITAAFPSFLRVQAFMKQPEAPNGMPRCEFVPDWMNIWPHSEDYSRMDDAKRMSVRIQGSFSWSVGGPPVLRDVDLAFEHGTSVGIIGKVGSGKSTLLQTALGELHPIGESRTSVPFRMGYASQVPYIMEGTLRENILCNDPFDRERYNLCIFSSCLLPDLEILPGGEEVPIGSRGISLSGGQKARVSMARAAYCKAPLVLIDDPFSAVDSRTARHILDHFVHGPALEGRTKLIVTQPDAERIQKFDCIVIVDAGRVVAQGTPAQIMQTEEYQRLLSTHQKSSLNKDEESNTQQPGVQTRGPQSARVLNKENYELRDDESQGRGGWDTLGYFLENAGKWSVFVNCSSYLAVQLTFLFGNIVLERWSTVMIEAKASGRPLPLASTYFFPYLGWFVVSLLLYLVVWYSMRKVALNMSKDCHKDTMQRLVHAPVDKFFDKTPVGRIMNRIVTDLVGVDLSVVSQLSSLESAAIVAAIPLVYVHILMPLYFTICTVPLYFLLLVILRRYWNCMVPMRYLMHVTKSENDVTLTEVETANPFVRALQCSERTFTTYHCKMMAQLSADLASRTYCIRWITLRVLTLLSFYVTTMVLIAVWVPGIISFGAVGLCLSNLLTILVSAESDLDTATQAQFQFISMNRVYEYTMIPQELPNELEGDDKYKSFSVKVDVSRLGQLQQENTEDGIIIYSVQGGRREVMLVQGRGGAEHFEAPDGRTLSVVDPSNAQLAKTVPGHRVAGVRAISGNAAAMAQELCSLTSDDEHVSLQVMSGWCADGVEVVVEDFTIGYGDAPKNILQDVNITVKACSNVGIVGATGCGKSTLLLSLLRIIERRGGRILMNGVDIASVGLLTLRTTIGLVPQDPVLMQCSLRDNLDPFHLFEDEQIWDGLRLVHLDDWVTNHPEGLNQMISSEGTNMSFGQRQLLCLARLVIRKPSLILLDEATSALDPRTQELVQKTIETSFFKSTIIVIAHRLETILNFDQVVVMDAGKVVENGPVQELQKLKGGLFAKMLAAKRTW